MEFFSPEIIGAIMIGCMLFAIFVGFPISFTLIFLGLVLVIGVWKISFLSNDTPIQYDNDREYSSSPTLYFYGDIDGQAGLMERLFNAVQLMLSKTRGALFYAVMFVSTIFAAATGIVGASVTILGIVQVRL